MDDGEEIIDDDATFDEDEFEEYKPSVAPTKVRSLAELVGAHLLRERVARGISQRALAERAGVTQPWLSRLERGKTEPNTRRISDLFAVLDLQIRVEIEPIGTDLDEEIERYGNLSDEERAQEVEASGYWLDKLAGLPWVLSGRLAALAQGAPVSVRRIDLAVAKDDLPAFAALFERVVCLRWSQPWLDWGYGPVDPRLPGPLRWLLGNYQELRLEIADDLPRSVTVHIGQRTLPVVPLGDLETIYPDIARVMSRWRRGTRSAPG